MSGSRRPLVVGNWKMNGLGGDLATVAAIARHAAALPGVEAALCVPATLIERAARRAPGLAIGAQDCHAAPAGAFTGGVSAAMLADAGARLVIVGHSERRADGDDDDAIRAKAKAAIGAGLRVLLCVGERDEGDGAASVAAQLTRCLPQITGDVVVAYEPCWAIGTGRSPAVRRVVAVTRALREVVGGEGARVLYGGSVTPANAAALIGAGIDGLLVGGASLDAATFGAVLAAATATR